MDSTAAPAPLTPIMGVEEVNAYLTEVYPQLNQDHPAYRVTEVRPGGCSVRLTAGKRHLRPGDTVSGPVLFTLADIGGYVCALSHIGREALAVTTNVNINFMRKAQAGEIDAACRILKLGRSLMVFEAAITAGPDQTLVAHATGTYSLPQRGKVVV